VQDSALALTRLELSQYRDRLLNTEKLARKTVSKQVGMISTLLEVGFDAGLLTQNIARGQAGSQPASAANNPPRAPSLIARTAGWTMWRSTEMAKKRSLISFVSPSQTTPYWLSTS